MLISKIHHVQHLFASLFTLVSLQVVARNRRQVGNASVHLRLLLRPPWPLLSEKEEKEGGRGAAARL